MVSNINEIRKRNGQIAKFDKSKITEAIWRAAQAVGGKEKIIAEQLSDKVVELITQKFTTQRIPTVEEVQDAVEKVLIENGHAKTAKAYIIYRQKRADLRQEKKLVLEKEEIDEVDKKFDINALKVLKARYLRKDEQGHLIETPKELFTRVATHAALPNLLYDQRIYNKNGGEMPYGTEEFDPVASEFRFSVGKFRLNRFHLEALKRMYDRFNKDAKMKVGWSRLIEMLHKGELNNHEEEFGSFYNLMVSRKFMPNTPAIANFGNPLGMGSACFVLGIDDTMESIMDTLKQTSLVFKAGGGMGYNFSKLRPEGDFVSTTTGVASGPMSFMRLFDTMTEVVKQGGIRRGANMGILNSNHPDIEKFIKAKEGNKALRNFNISVLIMSDFWQYYKENKPYPLVNPRTGQVVREVNPKMLFDMIVYQAWESAEPGVIFYDRVNDTNPFYEHLGPIITTNPCVTADTLIATENGLERIDSIKDSKIAVDTRMLSSSSGDQQTLQFGTQFVKPLQVIKTGIKETYKLTTKAGYEVTATADHRIMTSNGWKQLEELTTEDYICIQSGEGKFNGKSELPFKVINEYVGENGRTYKLNLPTKWTPQLGLLLGWLTGDGFIEKHQKTIGLVFAPSDQEAKDVIQPIFEKYCNRKIKPAEYSNGCVQLRSNSKYVVNFFVKLGYNPNEREVPHSLFTAPKDTVLAFLSGLFSSDGTLNLGSESRNYARLNSSSIKLLKQVQLLLLNLGIKSSIYDRSTKPKLFQYTAKNGQLRYYETSGTNYELNISKENLSRFTKMVNFVQKKNTDKVAQLAEFEFYAEKFLDKVSSKESIGLKEVWDITEPSTHSFIANGIIVHNCGEVLLYPNESCNLGSLNVWAFVKEDDKGQVYFDWEELKTSTVTASVFLDNIIDVNKFPLKEIEDMTLATRKIGLGIMGLGDLLYELRLPYNSEEGRKFMGKLIEFINYYSKVASIALAKDRGELPYYNKSFYPKGKMPFSGFDDKQNWSFNWDEIADAIGKYGVRNGYTTVIAPTGSISMIAGCSSGIEPVYSLVFEKNVKVGSFFYMDHVFEKVMMKEGLYDDNLMKAVNDNNGSLQNIPYIPPELKRVFVTAMDIKPEDHIRALAAFQKWVDSSISKTNNFPANATVDDMRESYLLAYELGCKDVTVFRDTSIKNQVLVAPKKKEEPKEEVAARVPEQAAEKIATSATTIQKISSKAEIKNCPTCTADVKFQEGCVTCTNCGWGLCT